MTDLDPPWEFGPEGERFEVEVTGDPGTSWSRSRSCTRTSIEEGLRRNPGIVATAMHCVNAVPYVCAAEPGLLTYLDLPLVAGRAALGPAPRGRARVILDRFRLDDRVAIVTGAGQGIGRGIAVGLAEAGADVVLAARTETDLEEVAGAGRASRGRRALVVPTDVTDSRGARAPGRAHRRRVRPPRHAGQQRRRRHAPRRDGHQRGVPRAGLPLQRHGGRSR